MMRAVVSLLVAFAPLSAAASELARTLSADPSAPTARFGWLQGTRGRISVPITFVGDLDRPGFALLFEPLIELHNGPDQPAPIPFELWRGRLSLELAHRWDLASGSFALGLRIEHESDHRSVQASSFFQSVPAFVYVNDVAFRVAWTPMFGSMLAGVAVTTRVHVASCTVSEPRCEDVSFGGVAPDVSVDLVFDSAGGAPELALTAALNYQIAGGSDRIEFESRLEALAGLRLPTQTRGTFYLQAALQAGSEIGLRRRIASIMGGAFVGWSP